MKRVAFVLTALVLSVSLAMAGGTKDASGSAKPYAGKTLTDKAFIMILPIGLFVSSGFEHSVANMFMIPLGIITAHFSGSEFWQAIGLNPEQYADLDVYHFIVKNLIPVTLGNIIGGGVCIALYQWYTNRPH